MRLLQKNAWIISANLLIRYANVSYPFMSLIFLGSVAPTVIALLEVWLFRRDVAELKLMQCVSEYCEHGYCEPFPSPVRIWIWMSSMIEYGWWNDSAMLLVTLAPADVSRDRPLYPISMLIMVYPIVYCDSGTCHFEKVRAQFSVSMWHFC